MSNFSISNLAISHLLMQYRSGDLSPDTLLPALRTRAKSFLAGNPNHTNPIWISLISEMQLQKYLDRLKQSDIDALPLYGIPFAIKDNIDLANLETTAACPAFSYHPKKNATVVGRLIAAGAIPLGKTNLDQFATGLVGTRSPYGACKNAFDPEWISGGSSSGSAIAVAEGLVSFSLGTDTAGSGRVPAALNKLVGLKPSKGLLSTAGVVPACRTLDCVSIFAQTASDANVVFDVATVFDHADPYSRKNSFENGSRYFSPPQPKRLRLGIPKISQLFWDDNEETEACFNDVLNVLKNEGVEITEIDFDPFLKAAKLLYEGPWVAERYLATQALLNESPESMHPVVRSIVEKGDQARAIDAFSAQYDLQACKASADRELEKLDAILTPTIPSPYRIDELLQNPIQLNSHLGYYTNFMNLLDYAAVAVPTSTLKSSIGFGVTIFHKAFSDKRLLGIAAAMQNIFDEGVNAEKSQLEATDHISVAVCGAHMKGLPLNWQLKERGAAFEYATFTSLNYKLFVLPGGAIARPGLVRVEEAGCAIPLEVWSVPKNYFGSFVSQIPAPLGIGKVELSNGQWVSGFICEPYGLSGARDITDYGGWRNYLDAVIELD